jgi:hypothetical protein
MTQAAQQAKTNGAAAKPAPATNEVETEAEAPSLIDMLNGSAELPEREEQDETEATDDEAAEETADDETEGEEPSQPEAAAAGDDEAEGAGDDGDEQNDEEVRKAFAPEALKTAAGVKRAAEIATKMREAAEHRQKRLDRFDRRLHKRERNWNAKKTEEQQGIENEKATGRHMVALLGQMRRGNARERLAALSALTGVPGVELIEELNTGILADGKQPAPSREVLELRATVEQLLQEQAAREEQSAQAHAQANRNAKIERIDHHRREAAELGTDAEKFPLVAAEIEKWGEPMSAQVGDWVVKFITDHHKKTGVRLDKATALGKLNARLAAKSGEPRKGSSVRDPAKSPVAQRRSAGRGVTVTPDLADRSTGSARELSRDERIDELARDPEALRGMGLGAFID